MGNFKGDPRKFMEHWFDPHLYVANWGRRRLMMRFPKRFLNRTDINPFLRDVDWVEVLTSGDNLIIDIYHDEAEPDDDWDDGSGWLAVLASLRADVLSGDLRLFYLLWLAAVQEELVSDDVVEPLPGIGPLSGALEAFATFFGIDPDLVRAAAESGAGDATVSKDELREALTAIAETDKTELLQRLVEGDSHVAAELKSRIRKTCPELFARRRTVSALRMRAREIREALEHASAKRWEAGRRRQVEQAEQALRTRLDVLKQRGATVWREIEDEIERRNASGYDRAASLLSDLQALAGEEGKQNEFNLRLASIRAQHANKGKFIERLTKFAPQGASAQVH